VQTSCPSCDIDNRAIAGRCSSNTSYNLSDTDYRLSEQADALSESDVRPRML